MQLFSASLPSRVNIVDAFIALHSTDQYSFCLDREHNPANRFSVIGAASQVHTVETSDFSVLQEILSSYEVSEAELPFDFRPGLVGAISYEGQAKFLGIDRAIVVDHDNNAAWFIGLFDTEGEFVSWRDAALLRLALIGGEGAVYRHKNPIGSFSADLVMARHSDEKYLELISLAKESIARGDVYQLCLTNQLSVETGSDPLAVFIKLRELNPAPYLSFLRFGKTTLVSSSPEQFLRATAEGKLSSKPIKGTRPRSKDIEEDKAIALELSANEKERAENLMIVDLMRNDLGRVSAPEDVVVEKLFDIESYSSVHQLVSTITARLKPGLNVFDAAKSCFPAGSMTGAPKIRAIEILQGLEQGNRGLYSGVHGYVTASGAADLAMTIRTIVFEEGVATIGIGGGITIDSDPEAELLETKLKAKALLMALGVQQ